MSSKQEDKPVEVKKVKKVVKAPVKPKHTFIKVWKTEKREYKVGDGLDTNNKNIVNFLLKYRYIK